MPELVQVSSCDNPHRRGDVVFVHGLNGNPRDYWGMGGSYWPDWLGEDLSDVGVWSLGYENAALKPRWFSPARLFLQGGFAMPLSDRAKNVLLRLELEGLGDKPLVFITHSMGGLLVKQMLRTANDSSHPRWRAILEQTRGVCFIATPHIGSDLAKWASYFRTLLGTNVSMEELRPHHSNLRELNQWYRDFAAKERVNIKTVSFYEMKPLPVIGLVVEQGDADPGVPHAGLYPLDADHRSICRPTTKKTELHMHTVEFVGGCFTALAKKRLHFDDQLKVNIEARLSSRALEPYGSWEPLHLEVELTITNLGTSPVFVVKAQLADKRSQHLLSFAPVCDELNPLQPGARRKAILSLLYHEKFSRRIRNQDDLDQENRMAFRILRFICQTDSVFRVETGRGTVLTFPALDVCDDEFLRWPVLGTPQNILDELKAKTLDDFMNETRAAFERSGVTIVEKIPGFYDTFDR